MKLEFAKQFQRDGVDRMHSNQFLAMMSLKKNNKCEMKTHNIYICDITYGIFGEDNNVVLPFMNIDGRWEMCTMCAF